MDTYPPGKCQCGCGRTTSICQVTNPKCGHVKGTPHRFYLGHKPPRQRFRIDPETGCHIWLGSKWGRGYGTKKVDNKSIPAHQYYWERANGPKPPGTEIDHLCKNILCVNPAHLEPVTHLENVRRGNRAKLTLEKANQIRAAYSTRKRGDVQKIANQFGVNRSVIHKIVSGELWR